MLAAMSTAINNGLNELIIHSKSEAMHSLIYPRFFAPKYSETGVGSNQDLIKRVVELKSQFKLLHHVLIRGDTRGQEEAAKLARLLMPIIRTEVVISGVQTAKGVIRYGVYFGEKEEQNESGRIHGEQHLLIGELTAIKRAIIIALSLRIRFLTIRTTSARTVYFMNGEYRQWVQRQWMVNKETKFPCAKIGMQVVDLMKKIVCIPLITFEILFLQEVRTVLCPDSEASEAVALAQTAQLSRHVPVYTSGSCYYCPLEKSEASYRVFWKTDNEKNDVGSVRGSRNVICARLTAVVKALEIVGFPCVRRFPKSVDSRHIKMESSGSLFESDASTLSKWSMKACGTT